MKKLLISAFLFAAGGTMLLHSQTLKFYYYDVPSVISANFTTGEPSAEPGYDKVLITASNVAKFRTIGSPNLESIHRKLTTTGSPLNKSATRLTSISNAVVRSITFNMVNDASGLPDSPNENDFCRRYNDGLSKDIAWPCALNSRDSGTVWFGENAAGRGDFEGTVLHELSHTQTLSDIGGYNSRYGLKNGLWISYGGDEGHYLNELMGDQQAAMDEAFGNYWKGVHDSAWLRYAVLNFSGNRDFFLGSHSMLTGTREVWDAPHTVLIDTTFRSVTATTGPTFNAGNYAITLRDSMFPPSLRYIARLYKFCNVPGKVSFHSELLTEVYLHMFHQYAFQLPDSALRAINRFARYYASPTPYQKHRYPPSMAMYLAADIEAYNTRTSGHPANEQRVSSIFPLALYDLLTHFGSTDVELTRVFTIATYDMDGLTRVPSSKAFRNYFAIRNDLKSSLLPKLYNGSDCATAPSLDLHGSVAALKAYCRLPETLALTR